MGLVIWSDLRILYYDYSQVERLCAPVINVILYCHRGCFGADSNRAIEQCMENARFNGLGDDGQYGIICCHGALFYYHGV